MKEDYLKFGNICLNICLKSVEMHMHIYVALKIILTLTLLWGWWEGGMVEKKVCAVLWGPRQERHIRISFSTGVICQKG